MKVIQVQVPDRPILFVVQITYVDYMDNTHLGDSIQHFLLQAWRDNDCPKEVEVCFDLPGKDRILGSNLASPMFAFWKEMKKAQTDKENPSVLYLVNCPETEIIALSNLGLPQLEDFHLLADSDAPGYREAVRPKGFSWGWLFFIAAALFFLWRMA